MQSETTECHELDSGGKTRELPRLVARCCQPMSHRRVHPRGRLQATPRESQWPLPPRSLRRDPAVDSEGLQWVRKGCSYASVTWSSIGLVVPWREAEDVSGVQALAQGIWFTRTARMPHQRGQTAWELIAGNHAPHAVRNALKCRTADRSGQEG